MSSLGAILEDFANSSPVLHLFHVLVLVGVIALIALHARVSRTKSVLSRRQTALETSEQALRESEARHVRLLEAAAEGILTIAPTGAITYANRRMRAMLGFEHDDVCGHSLFEFVPEELCVEVRAVLDAQGEDLKEYEEIRLARRDGTQFWASVAVTVVKSDTGEVTEMLGLFSDITARKQAQEELEQSEEKYRRLYELESDAIFLIENNEGRILEVNPAACRLYGYTRDEMLTKHNHDMSAEPDDTRAATREQRPTVPIRYHRTKNGDVFPVEITACFFTWKDQPVHIAAIRDITPHLDAQRELEEQRLFLRKVLDSVPTAIVVKDTGGRTVMANETMVTQLGYLAAGYSNATRGELCLTTSQVAAIEADERTIVEGKRGIALQEEQAIDSAGKTHWLQRVHLPMISSDGKVSHVIGVYTDLTSRIESEEERTRLVTAIEQAAEAIAITDIDGKILYVNPAFSRVTGYSREEALGENPRILKSGMHDELFYQDLWQMLCAGEVWRGRFVNRRKDGTLYEEEATISPVRDRSGGIVNYVAVKRDVTNEAQLERRLRQAEKMEAIGTLAGGIAHDFNNILAIILGYAEIMKQESSDAGDLISNLQQVCAAAQRGKDLVRQILTFSGRTDTKPAPCHLPTAIEEAFRLLRPSIPATIDIVLDVCPTEATVLAAPPHIHQVIVNLCTNAYQAMEHTGGTLRVALEEAVLDADDIPPSRLTPGTYLKLTVSDTGSGMDAATKERIFEPFFTTKSDGRGTGLGLAVVHGIVMELKGDIVVQSEPGVGATFWVYLPCVQIPLNGAAPVEQAVSYGRGERLWIVDDETALLQASARLFERFGYRVTTFENPVEALAQFNANPGAVDLVITDQSMPRLTGVDLAKALLAVRGNLPILLATGFTAQFTPEDVRRLGIREFVPKPFVFRELSSMVRRLLDETANSAN